MRDEDLLKEFYSNKDSDIVNYNFDLKELIDNFSIFNFIKNGIKACTSEQGIDFGAFFICTPKQYIIAYNSNFGSGSHITSKARAMKDIQGGGTITSIAELTKLGDKCTNNYITGRLAYENDGFGLNEIRRIRGVFEIVIKNNDSSISRMMFESFKKFYEDYNREIEAACNNSNGSFKVSFFNKDTKKRVESNNLDLIYNYLENHIDENLDDEEDEVIIGVETTEKRVK